jgi:hypothetical protein
MFYTRSAVLVTHFSVLVTNHRLYIKYIQIQIRKKRILNMSTRKVKQISATFNNQKKLAIVRKFRQDTFRFHTLFKLYFSLIFSLHLDEETPFISSLFDACEEIKEFKVCKSVHTFQINQPTRCNKFWSLLLDVYSYVQLNMFRASSRPSSWVQQLR